MLRLGTTAYLTQESALEVELKDQACEHQGRTDPQHPPPAKPRPRGHPTAPSGPSARLPLLFFFLLPSNLVFLSFFLPSFERFKASVTLFPHPSLLISICTKSFALVWSSGEP